MSILMPACVRACLPACLSTDFKNDKDMTDYLSSNDPKVQPARKELRGMAASTMRSAVALPATSFKGDGAKVAKERGYMP